MVPTMSMNVSDRTLDVLLDHLRDQDLMILARLADGSEPYYWYFDQIIYCALSGGTCTGVLAS